MKVSDNKHRIIPVRFAAADLERLEAKAALLRLSVASYVRMQVATMLLKDSAMAE